MRLKWKMLIVVIIIVILAWFVFHIPKVKPVMKKKKDQIRVMSYNLRYAASDYEMWEKRKDKLAEQILDYMPDSLGIQEGDARWMDESSGLPHLLEGYSYVGVGRDDGETSGEYTAIFYITDKYEVIDSGTFWISQTPDVVSKGWDATTNRICTWATLKNKETGELYTHFNTHLDHEGKQARAQGVELLLEKIGEYEKPFVLTGDFNFMQGTKNYKTLIDSKLVSDSKFEANDSMSYGTMNWFKLINFRYLPPIDFCFVSSSTISVDSYRVDNSYIVEKRPVSDHYPIIVDFMLKAKD